MSKTFINLDATTHKRLAAAVLAKTQPRLVSFEESVWPVREALARRLAEAKNWSEAADVLAGIEVQPSSAGSGEYKLKITLETANMYLEANELDKAEKHVNKTHALLSQLPAELQKKPELLHEYHACWAKVSDRVGKFMDAALRYTEMSQLENQSDAGTMTRAVVCAILSSSVQRDRLLRSFRLDTNVRELPVYPFLEKIEFRRIIRADEAKEFQTFLSPHHVEVRADGVSAFEQAIMEHNLESMKYAYENISFDHLGEILGVSDAEAEKLAAKLIYDQRVQGYIDQVDRFVYFDNVSPSHDDPVSVWNANVISVSHRLNEVVETITKLVEQ